MKFTKQPVVLITKKIEFSSAHRLVNHDLSEEENLELYDKCYNPNGHGHNYILEVTLKGPISKKTGMIINLTSLKNVINRSVVDIMDHKNLNEDVEHFKDLNPTAENLIVVIWKLLEKEFEEQLLYRLVLRETSNNIVEYYGEEI
ncbi:MAG: 6-carboxytetrahydropterin synthase [Rickettsiales bacterium]|nr:6-carboxytetrahydropterin synthase [Rickettsiales bacterium]